MLLIRNEYLKDTNRTIVDRGDQRRKDRVQLADIFISYSKPDRDKVVMLAAYLESEGWTVWWDNNLAAGDAFRDEIMKQLAVARAVIVLWTPNSIKSDFVRAEAGRAKADGKLIPVKADDVSYGDIPLPFGEMHVEDIGKRELIRDAVVAQLAKPALQPSAVHVATKTLRYQVLTWFGIVGGAITLFTHLREALNLADWARWLVTHWHEWTNAFWQWCFSLIQIRVPQHWTGLLSFLFFATVIVLSQRMIAAKAQKRSPNVVVSDAPALPLLRVKTAVAVAAVVLVPVLAHLGRSWVWAANQWTQGSLIASGIWLLLLILFILSPQIMLVVASKHRLKAGCVVFFATLFFLVIALPVTIRVLEEVSNLFAFAFLMMCSGVTAAMLLVAPIDSLSKRLTFLAVGLILLIALNQLSHYAPDIREWLKPPV